MGSEDSEMLPGQTKNIFLCDSVLRRTLKAESL
jgi:hypothetical protein